MPIVLYSVPQTDLVCFGVIILQNAPVLAIVTITNLKSREELDRAKVLGPLGNDAGDPFGGLQVHLVIGAGCEELLKSLNDKVFHQP